MEIALPKVTIIAATETDPVRAAALLIFTKSTRLNMSPDGLFALQQNCEAEPKWMMKELSYMAKTIRSSWEFLDVTFMIEGVSRACAQQITRTRQASYAMQSQRVSDIRNQPMVVPDKILDIRYPERLEVYQIAHEDFVEGYTNLVDKLKMAPEDARGVSPINLSCNLCAKYNLRTLADLIPARTSYRAQGEYREIAEQMKEQVLAMWPWSKLFFAPRYEIAVDLLRELRDFVDDNADVGVDEVAHHIKLLASKVQDTIEGGEG